MHGRERRRRLFEEISPLIGYELCRSEWEGERGGGSMGMHQWAATKELVFGAIHPKCKWTPFGSSMGSSELATQW